MPVGSKWQLFVPSDLGYGDRGADPRSGIGPGSTLVFEVELVSIQAKDAKDKEKLEAPPN
jgi:FKBP-type peptidyl-prolyl cis-trans isomerase FklB